jgi:hypothetical protein
MRAYSQKDKSVYPAGSFYGWQNDFIRDVSSAWKILDPRDHRQGAIAKLVEDDMGGVKKANAIFCKLPMGKSLPTMTYAELGSARVQLKPVILVDENEKKDPIINWLSSNAFSKYEEGIEFLLHGDFELTNRESQERPATNPVKRIAFSGNFSPLFFQPFLGNSTGKKYFNAKIFDIEELEKADLLAVSFERGNRNKEAIAIMGAAYTLGIPIALHEPNPIVYPPLAGLARRIFTGEQGLEMLGDYLAKIQTNDIDQEAVLMYDLFKKYNS